MSKNLKDQNSIELDCLNKVRSRISPDDCFGVSKENYKDLKMWIESAVSNTNTSEFPDFLFDDGFIEHFSITSSLEGRKGSKQKAESSKLQAKSQRDFLLELDKSQVDSVTKHSVNRYFEPHSHSNIVRSINRNWEKHIKSYDDYSLTKNHSIFLMEYIDFALQTAVENKGKPVTVYNSYRISSDKELLKWIYKFKDKIEYLIMFHEESLEIIRIDKISELIESLPNGMFAPVVGMETHRYVGWKQEK